METKTIRVRLPLPVYVELDEARGDQTWSAWVRQAALEKARKEKKPETKPKRIIPTNIPELDQLLGGGIHSGSSIMLSSDPGVGKTSLILQALKNINSLYCSGEQTEQDLLDQMKRIGSNGKLLCNSEGLSVLTVTDQAIAENVDILVIDSMQTTVLDDVIADFGTARQLEAVANYLTSFAQKTGIAVIFINHNTKEGKPAGPKSLEHLVDVDLRMSMLNVYDNQDRIFTGIRSVHTLKNKHNKLGRVLLDMDGTGFHFVTAESLLRGV